MKESIIKLELVALIIFAQTASLFAEGGDKIKNNSPKKILGTPAVTRFNINNISTRIGNDGTCDNNSNSNLGGLEYPKGSGKKAIYQGGFVWGGKVNGQIRVGGSTYRSGLMPGKIIQKGTAQNPQDPSARIYRVRKDFATANLSSEMNDGEGTADQIRAQYQKDWNEWPAADGAPFTDVDHDGIYNPSVDIPGVPGADQTIFYIANDLDTSKTSYLYGSTSVGLELHVTVWGYKQPSPFDNMIFKKYQIINKSDTNYTDACFGIWSDVDDGDAVDDVDGCDTLLNLGYTYNFTHVDAVYSPLPPPAVGFTILQGPIVDGLLSDTAYINGRIILGKKNLPMTSIGYIFKFNEPPQGIYLGSIYMYNLLQGALVNGDYISIPPELGSGTTKFPYSGDPVTGTGFLDTQPFDHRIMVNSGPFNLAPSDTQEIVFAEILAGAQGSISNIAAVSLLKTFTENAQLFYKNNLSMPLPIAPPKVTATGLDREIIISWGNDIDSINETENYISGNSKFEGYNVYQLPTDTSSIKDGIRIATFDIVDGVRSIIGRYIDPKSGDILTYDEQYGNDTGIQRFIDIKSDTLTGKRLNNGSKYYFAVTAYTYNPIPGLFNHSMESESKIFTVVPQSFIIGVRYEGSYGQQIDVIHSQGKSGGNVIVKVIDPTLLTGDTYKINFSEDSNQIVWSLIDSTTGKIKLQNQTDQSGTPAKLLVDGMQISVYDAAYAGVKYNYTYLTSRTRVLTWANAAYGFEGIYGAVGWASPAYLFGDGKEGVPASELNNVLLVFAQVNDTTSYNPYFNMNDTNMSYGYRYGRNFSSLPAQAKFAQYIINKNGVYAFQDFVKGVPLSAWDVDDPTHPRRLALGFLENNKPNGLVDGKYWPPNYLQLSNASPDGPREWLFIFNTDYTTKPNSQYEVDAINNPLPIMYISTLSRRGPITFSPDYTGEDQFFIEANHVNTPNDVFTFTSPAISKSIARAKQDVYLINVFPNPYYGYNAQSNNRYRNFVTFSHLPQKAVIRIFNLAGTEVTEIDKDNPDQFQQWYLYNNSGIPLASGLYIAYIEMPELGVTKILKIAIIQPQAIPERY